MTTSPPRKCRKKHKKTKHGKILGANSGERPQLQERKRIAASVFYPANPAPPDLLSHMAYDGLAPQQIYDDIWKILNNPIHIPIGYTFFVDFVEKSGASSLDEQGRKEYARIFVPHWPSVLVIHQAFDKVNQGVAFGEAATWLINQPPFQNRKSMTAAALRNVWLKVYKRKVDNFETDSEIGLRLNLLRERSDALKPKDSVQKKAFELRKQRRAAANKISRLESKLKELNNPAAPAPNKLNKPSTKGAKKDVPSAPSVPSVPNEPNELSPPKRTRFAAKEIIFEPNPGPQTEFLAAPEREVLYGGAAGGGKSYGLLADPMRYFGHKQFNGLILRRTNDELRELVWKSQEVYPRAYQGAKWQEKKSQWVFPSGARLWMTYLEREEDVLRYQGQAFSYIGFDELTQHATPFSWNYMRSRLRTTASDLPIYMRATSNPGGPGHQWVKRMFIDPAPPNKAFPATDIDTGKVLAYPESHARSGRPLFYRRFIPATLRDNPYLYEEGSYEANLLSLPEMQKRQLLEGDWAIAEGAAFKEFRPSLHVIAPFEIPHTWRRFRSCDFGYSSYSAVHWYAIDPAYETLYVYRELYVGQHTAKELARVILQAEDGENISYGVLDSSCWHNRGQIGPSIAEEMISMGCRWRPSDRTNGARVAGRNRLHELLKVDDTTDAPKILFFNTCRQIIADLPVIPTDPKGTDDIDPRFASDHSYDSIRYGIMSRPRGSSPFDDWGGDNSKMGAKTSWVPASIRFGY